MTSQNKQNKKQWLFTIFERISIIVCGNLLSSCGSLAFSQFHLDSKQKTWQQKIVCCFINQFDIPLAWIECVDYFWMETIVSAETIGFIASNQNNDMLACFCHSSTWCGSTRLDLLSQTPRFHWVRGPPCFGGRAVDPLTLDNELNEGCFTLILEKISWQHNWSFVAKKTATYMQLTKEIKLRG